MLKEQDAAIKHYQKSTYNEDRPNLLNLWCRGKESDMDGRYCIYSCKTWIPFFSGISWCIFKTSSRLVNGATHERKFSDSGLFTGIWTWEAKRRSYRSHRSRLAIHWRKFPFCSKGLWRCALCTAIAERSIPMTMLWWSLFILH